MEDNNKSKKLLIIGMVSLLLFVVGASYAYFTVGTTNNFGTHTISGTMEGVGSVALTSTNNNISLNLTAVDMMQGNDDIYYSGTTDGTPATDDGEGIIKLADAIVVGSGTYDCDYTLSITASGTNNMYTVFQGMSGKSENQIMFAVGSYNLVYYGVGDGSIYDFNTANLFPITINGHFEELSISNPGSIYGAFFINNSSIVNQTALAGTDITMNATVTSFTCASAVPYLKDASSSLPTTKFINELFDNNKYDNNSALINNGYDFYVKEITPPIEKKVANKHFYVAVFGDNYSNIEDCMNQIDNDEISIICVKNSNYYNISIENNKPYRSIFDSLEECENSEIFTDCVEYNKGDVYYEYQSPLTYYVCAIFNNEELCLKNGDWDNWSNYQTQFENEGATCLYSDGYPYNNLICTLSSITFHIDESGYVACTKYLGQDDQLYCSIPHDNNNYCSDVLK